MAGAALTEAAPAAARAGAARRLMAEREAIARAVTARLYDERADLLERHGARGREKCLQDMLHNVDHLIPAVDLGDPSMFAHYVEWLDGLLRARSVDTTHLVRCLELLADEGAARCSPEEGAALRPVVEEGLRVLASA
jgi:hypothetical protein